MSKLIIGDVSPGWDSVDINPNRNATWCVDASMLTGVPNNLYDVVYASHVLEHVPHEDVTATLRRWREVLSEGGWLYVSVPNVFTIAHLLVDSDEHDEYLLRVLYGGHTNQWDSHQSGFTSRHLRMKLKEAGFRNIGPWMGGLFFHDCSTLKVSGLSISLNLKAQK